MTFLSDLPESRLRENSSALWKIFPTDQMNSLLKEIFHFNLGDFPFIDISITGF